MSLFLLIFCFIFLSLIYIIFFFLSKMEKWDPFMASIFECGFSAYFFSRFSFSIHYFILALIFLFLDLELCMLMPFFNEPLVSINLLYLKTSFIMLLLLGLIQEWVEGKLNWNF